jgi:hypothetical protein
MFVSLNRTQEVGGSNPPSSCLLGLLPAFKPAFSLPVHGALIGWLPLVVFIACGAASIFFAVDGDSLVAIANGLIAFVNLAHLALNPMVRPQQVARSLAASREGVASSR